MQRTPKLTPAKFLYDARGSELFQRICRLPEYYLTRTELALLQRHAPEIAAHLGTGITLIEPGAGDAAKVRILMGCRQLVAAYVPIDVSRAMLTQSARAMRLRCPGIVIHPICGDFTRHLDSVRRRVTGPRVIFFPGSTLGNSTPEEAIRLLRQFREAVRPDGAVIIGIDHCKDPAVITPAYNDAAGITARFNLNLLHRLNRDFSADFRPDLFAHSAIWVQRHHRIEMRLVSSIAHEVHLGPHRVAFAAGEPLTTEYSYKPTLAEFAELASTARLQIVGRWLDREYMFGIYCLR